MKISIIVNLKYLKKIEVGMIGSNSSELYTEMNNSSPKSL
jgi:hypothetical protein